MFLNESIAKKPPPTLHGHISGISHVSFNMLICRQSRIRDKGGSSNSLLQRLEEVLCLIQYANRLDRMPGSSLPVGGRDTESPSPNYSDLVGTHLERVTPL
eukprot:sb/3478503/